MAARWSYPKSGSFRLELPTAVHLPFPGDSHFSVRSFGCRRRSFFCRLNCRIRAHRRPSAFAASAAPFPPDHHLFCTQLRRSAEVVFLLTQLPDSELPDQLRGQSVEGVAVIAHHFFAEQAKDGQVVGSGLVHLLTAALERGLESVVTASWQ